MTLWERWLRHPQALWLRKAIFQVHLWSGIGVGLYIVVISVSGSVLVYRVELRQRYDPQPRYVVVSGERMGSEELTEAAQRAYPEHTASIFVEREDPKRAVTISIDRDGKRQQRLFDPYTGEDLGHALPLGWRLTTWLLDLHDNLLYGETGRSVNGVGALLMTLLSLTGAFIWWPGIQSWRRSLTIDWKANWRRLNWNLHSAIGFWTVAFVFLWGITGIYLSFPEPFMAIVNYLEPLDVSSFEPRLGDTILYWIAYLHFGRFAGWPTKLLWALLGLAPPIMFVTGVLMWWKRVLRPQEQLADRGKQQQGPRGAL